MTQMYWGQSNDMGWLSQSCGVNKVNCNRDVYGLTDNKCIKYAKKGETE